MRYSPLLIVCLLLLGTPGCTSKEKVFGSLYKGFQQREQVVHPPAEPPPPAQPSYDAYRQAREKIIKPE